MSCLTFNWLPRFNLGQMIRKQTFDHNLASQDDLPKGKKKKNVLISNMLLSFPLYMNNILGFKQFLVTFN